MIQLACDRPSKVKVGRVLRAKDALGWTLSPIFENQEGTSDPQVVSRACGLIEGPLHQNQTTLRPGCRLRIQPVGGSPESIRAVTVALEPTLPCTDGP